MSNPDTPDFETRGSRTSETTFSIAATFAMGALATVGFLVHVFSLPVVLSTNMQWLIAACGGGAGLLAARFIKGR